MAINSGQKMTVIFWPLALQAVLEVTFLLLFISDTKIQCNLQVLLTPIIKIQGLFSNLDYSEKPPSYVFML